MYRIIHKPTSATIANSSEWRTAAAALRTHAAHHCDNAYQVIAADPAAILHLSSMGDDAYSIQRDECDLAPCDTCGDHLGIVTDQSDDTRATGSWRVASCAPCAAEWERAHPREASDYPSDDIARTVLSALNPKRPTTSRRFTLGPMHTDCSECDSYGITDAGEVCAHCTTDAD